MSDNNNFRGVYRCNYIPSLKGSNPLKKENNKDWWGELCEKHGAENHFPKKKKEK